MIYLSDFVQNNDLPLSGMDADAQQIFDEFQTACRNSETQIIRAEQIVSFMKRGGFYIEEGADGPQLQFSHQQMIHNSVIRLPFPTQVIEATFPNVRKYADLVKTPRINGAPLNPVLKDFCQISAVVKQLNPHQIAAFPVTAYYFDYYKSAIEAGGDPARIVIHPGIADRPCSFSRGAIHLLNIDENGRFLNCAAEDVPEAAEQATGVFAVFIATVLHFMNWKREVDFPAIQPSRQIRRQCARAEEKPPVVYRTVNLGRWLKKYNSVSSDAAGQEKRFHAVRAHSASYSVDAPMFGCPRCKTEGHEGGERPHVGNFWVSPHFKGNKEIGESRHVYEVSPVEEGIARRTGRSF